jgi:hypothetical protein
MVSSFGGDAPPFAVADADLLPGAVATKVPVRRCARAPESVSLPRGIMYGNDQMGLVSDLPD